MKRYREEKEKELEELRRKELRERFKDDIIQAEIERLLKENLPYLDGFIPKGVILKEEHLNYVPSLNQRKYY